MNNIQLRQILMEIQHNLRCMQCGKSYKTENIHLRGAFKNMYLFQLQCENHAAFATITVVGQQNNIEYKAIEPEDALKFYQELKVFNGDFRSVFK